MSRFSRALLISFSLVFLFALALPKARADLVSDLNAKIDERNQNIADLEKEIAQYQAQVDKTSAQAKTLQNAIATLTLTQKKLSTEITVIEDQIDSTTLSITQLNIQISDSEATIARALAGISSTLEQTNEAESSSLVEALLNYPSISGFLDRIDSLSQLNQGLKTELENVRLLEQDLENKKTVAQGKRQSLLTLASNLSDKKKVADYTKVQTSTLLTQTKNQQALYEKTLQEKQALYTSFQQELLQYESQLKFAIDPTSLPSVGSGVLKWPLDKIAITQYFGNTDFAKTHPQAYNGTGHNGVDFRAAIGTPVKSALLGTVVGTGNTDTVCPNASYGQWVLVQNPNGLSTLYAHLSVIKVVAGQSVATGEVLGYSGETGYATGPHLHFTVYATQGVKIMSRKSAVCQGTYTMPVASLNAYLNPLSYL